MSFLKRHSAYLSLVVIAVALYSALGYVAYRFGWHVIVPKITPDVSGIVVLLALSLIYCLPTLAAIEKRHPDFWKIGTVNLLLGWTVIGWLGALLWAARSKASV